jgi:tetratricopeptide (TPR) repeat protein
MLALPVELLLGDPGEEGSMAANVAYNRHAFWVWLGFGEEAPPPGPGDDERFATGLAVAEAALEAGREDRARERLEQLLAEFPAHPRAGEVRGRLAEIERAAAERGAQDRAVEKLAAVQRHFDAGELQQARDLLAAMTLEERNLAAAAGADVKALELKIAAAIQALEETRQAEIRRQEVRNLLGDAARLMREKKYAEALAAYRAIANKYPAEDLPRGTDLAALVEKARGLAEGGTAPPQEPAPRKDLEKERADMLWKQALDLEKKENYSEAAKRLIELQALPPRVHPAGLEARLRDLERKAREKEKMEFFFGE